MADSVAARTLTPRALFAVVVERLHRLQPTRVPASLLAWTVACWVVAAAVLLALVWPSAVTATTAEHSIPGLVSYSAPLWFRLLGALVGAVAVGAFAAASARHGWALEAALAAAVLAPALVLAADRAWAFGLPTAAVGITALLLRPLPVPTVIPPLLASASWGILAGYQLTPFGASPGSWAWIVGVGLAAAVAAFGTYYGVARAAYARTRALKVLDRPSSHPLVVLSVVLGAAALVALRLTMLRDLFPAPDPTLWTPQAASLLSWLLSAVVAGVLGAVAIRSTSRPLLRSRDGTIIAGLAVLGNLHLVVAAAIIIVGLLGAVIGVTSVPTGWLAAVPALKVAGVVVLALVVLLPRFQGTAARWLMIIAALFLLPNTLAGLLRDTGVPAFAPSPVQVTILLVVTALALAIINLARPTFRPGLVMRLAVVPLIAVHAGWLLPAAWTPIGIIVVVFAVLITVLLRQPPPAMEDSVHSGQVIRGAAQLLLGLGLALLAAPALLSDGSLVVLGLVWLSVVATAALCFETVAREPREGTHGSQSPVQQHGRARDP